LEGEEDKSEYTPSHTLNTYILAHLWYGAIQRAELQSAGREHGVLFPQ
jgi:hypothetical protein